MMTATNPTPPNDFICPLSKKVMKDPVSSSSSTGTNYERVAIETWLRKLSYCPIHGTPLTIGSLKSNTSLQWKIRYWQQKHQQNPTDTETTDKEQQPQPQEDDEEEKDVSSPTVVILQKFKCPLTNQIMIDPVMTKTGYNFERIALMKWMAIHNELCPISGQTLKLSQIVSNSTLKRDIQFYTQKQQYQQHGMILSYPKEDSYDIEKVPQKLWKSSSSSKKSNNNNTVHTIVLDTNNTKKKMTTTDTTMKHHQQQQQQRNYSASSVMTEYVLCNMQNNNKETATATTTMSVVVDTNNDLLDLLQDVERTLDQIGA